MRDVRTVIHEVVKADPHGSVAELAAQVGRRVSKADLLELVEEAVEMEQRRYVREIERRAVFDDFTKGALSPSLPAPSFERDEFRALFAEKFALGDGTRVEWGQATVEQHEQRVAMLERMRLGIEETITRHREAVKAIQEAGVSCLDELEKAKVAA